MGMVRRLIIKKLEIILKELWDNDESVPAPVSTWCSRLDWFSQGIKDNILAYIAIEVLGKDKAKKLLDMDNR